MATNICTSVLLPDRYAPVLYDCDALIIGGSFAGISTALVLARAGKKVAVVEQRTYLGREITATLRPWVEDIRKDFSLPEVVERCITTSGEKKRDGYCLLHLDMVKTCLEDLLLNAGVKLLYSSIPIDMVVQDGRLQGVVLANKSGRQVINTTLVIDASETALMARLLGLNLGKLNGGFFSGVLEYEGVTPAENRVILLPPSLSGGRAILHPGWRGERHWLVEYEFQISQSLLTSQDLTRLEINGREQMIALATYLAREIPAFSSAYLAAISPELTGIKAPLLVDPIPQWATGVGAFDIFHKQQLKKIDIAAFACDWQGLWLLNESARLDDAVRQSLSDPNLSCQIGEKLGNYLAKYNPFTENATYSISSREPTFLKKSFEVGEFESPQQGKQYERQPVAGQLIPVVDEVDVLVVGGGSSGAIAAITAARKGMRTVLIEMNPGLGGTGTYGGVHSYWFGRRLGFSAQVMELVDELHDRLRNPRQEGDIPKWNIEAKITALIEAARQAGVIVILNSLVFAAMKEGDKICGVVAATRTGPIAILAKQIIDATGDGDVAAFAGAKFIYGAERDHSTMWYALAQFARPGITRNNFTSSVDVGNIEDYTRAILAGRRRGKPGQDHDHGIYIAPRESRHIQAAVTLTLSDQLLKRCWEDVINIAFSNNDIKGQSTSDWVRMGLISPNLMIEIPYRSLLPDGLENILVVGKAFSATHDSLPSLRMQPDLENLGGASAIAASLAIESNSTARNVDIRELQRRLVEVGLLPKDVLTRKLVPHRPTETELNAWIEKLDGSHPLYAYSDMEINEVFTDDIPIAEVCCAGERVVPLLESAFWAAEPGSSRRRLLAQALAAVGSKTGVPELVSALLSMLENGLPERDAQIRHAQLPPDQGAMPDAAYLLYSLGMAGDKRAIPVWERIVELLSGIRSEDLRDRNKGIFYYVDALCYGVERYGDPTVVPLMLRLHEYPPFHNQYCPSGNLRAFQPDYFLERQAYLELVIGRALARCGSPFGYSILVTYLNDSRALLAEHAHRELINITATTLGKDVSAWKNWLEMNADSIRPQPYKRLTDAQAAWGQEIMRESKLP